MATAEILREDYNVLRYRIENAIKVRVGDTKVDIEHEDEYNNNLVAIDKDSVYFNGGSEDYPLDELSIKDMLEILFILEE